MKLGAVSAVVGGVVFASATFDVPPQAGPYILEVAWPDGSVDHMAALNHGVCVIAQNALTVQPGQRKPLWSPVGRENQKPTYSVCYPGNLFEKGWDCIENFNCKTR